MKRKPVVHLCLCFPNSVVWLKKSDPEAKNYKAKPDKAVMELTISSDVESHLKKKAEQHIYIVMMGQLNHCT